MKSLKQTIYLETPKDFDFWCTVWSSGWCALAPFSYDRERRTLTRVQKLSSGKVVKAVISLKQRGVLFILAESYEKLDNDEVEELIEVTKTCLRLDEDLSPFYEMLEDYPTFSWVRRIGAGRSIRSPTVFEDLVKTICSTNCSWALTKAISHRLCSKIGDPFADGFFTFPTPKQLASKTDSFIKTEIKAGYRSPYLLELARKIVKGELDVEGWKRSLLDSVTLKREIMKIRGVGEYAADHILKLLGRYDFLALDSWLRKRFSKIHKKGEEASDEEIEEFYAPFGKWRGLVLWLDMMKDYLIPEKG